MSDGREALAIEASTELQVFCEKLNALRLEATDRGFEYVACVCQREEDGMGMFYQAHAVYGDGENLLDTIRQAIKVGDSK